MYLSTDTRILLGIHEPNPISGSDAFIHVNKIKGMSWNNSIVDDGYEKR
jgi:hypothetical protein